MKTLNRIVDWIFILSAFFCALYFVASLFPSIGTGAFWVATIAVGILAVPAILVHEMGHAWAAHVQGWKVHAINVSGLSYLPAALRLRFETPIGNGDVGGFVVTTTPKLENWAVEYARIVFAGPAANLLCALIFAVCARITADDAAVICSALAIINLIIGLQNLWPKPLSNGQSNDGHMLWRIKQGYRITPYELAFQVIAGMGYDGIPHSKWLEQIAQIEGIKSLSAEEMGGIHAGIFNLAFSQRKLRVAYEIWKEHLEGKWDLGATYHLCFALCSVLCGHDTKDARQILNETECADPSEEFYWWRVLVAVEIMEGDFTQATASADKAERAAVLARIKPDKDDRALLRSARTGQALDSSYE